MNFFGHAAIASSLDVLAPPGAVLGAMLPDFATMCRGRIASSDDDAVTTGIAWHHATDAAFHQLPVVTTLMRGLDGRLDRLGCVRGPRRAVAHIGIELLLDGVLVVSDRFRASYLGGLAHDAAICWRGPHDAERFAVLIARLRAHGVPDDLQSPDAIVARLARMLGHRPLLAPSTTDLVAIRTALIATQPEVELAAETVMRETLAHLAADRAIR